MLPASRRCVFRMPYERDHPRWPFFRQWAPPTSSGVQMSELCVPATNATLELEQPYLEAYEQLLDDSQMDAFRTIREVSSSRDAMHAIQAPTGFGKTVVGAAVADSFIKEGYTVLWITKKWRLLEQAASEIKRFFPGRVNGLRRLGGQHSELRHLPADGQGRIYFSTLQQWKLYADRGDLPACLRRRHRLLIIWDECHWAVNAAMGNALLDHYVKTDRRYHRWNALLIGLSATPKSHRSDRIRLAWGLPTTATLGTRTAFPIHRNIETGTVWSPVLFNQQVSTESLGELANDATRNEKIVAELVDGYQDGRYTRVVIFACNIPHAALLHRLVSKHGIASVILHSQRPLDARRESVRRFRDGSAVVLVNVNEFVEGDNVPEIDAVFIARPTTSEVLMKQMIGRGSRLTSSKQRFWVVEFTDDVRENASEFYSAVHLIDEVGSRRSQIDRTATRSRAVRHSAPYHPTLETLSLPEIGQIAFVPHQTFGIEIELTSPNGIPGEFSEEWERKADDIIDQLQQSTTVRVDPYSNVCPEYDFDDESDFGYWDEDCWRVTYDSSAGWEIVSPVLSDASGVEQVRQVCVALSELIESDPDLQIDYRTGLHVTLGTRLQTDEQIIGFAKRVMFLEPGLMTLVAPSRLYEMDEGIYILRHRNFYCAPLCETIEFERHAAGPEICFRSGDRYCSVNMTKAYENVQTIEVRLHNGTTEFRKIALWISLWMLICHRSRYFVEEREPPRHVFPGGNCEIDVEAVLAEDIFALLKESGIVIGRSMNDLIWKRRAELRGRWEYVLPKRVASWRRSGWYEPR